ncbi:hypothetical protein [Enterococcus faecalis]|uniref:hypothetical protein n=1 Tax=Enterococcus faecalis TaxID=1351 RepID=UPI00026D76F7|nr:hypothetical protein [Enterococcus faecalis]AFO45152.1 hypothetical protein EFD32_2270 [Enterococcus faecalis D32]EOM23152.1 hypothetical protein U9C_02268 [Enterococcus faecalis EnGen0253]EOM30141.1 hypothetical protein U9G_02475 [Enterococcus faecalis EnGen0232]NMP43760.1 hypothetical protein [Enterococcus faecalis]
MSRLSKINDLAFDLMHEYMEPSKQFSYGKQIYDLSDEPELNENQQTVLDWLKKDYSKNRWTSPFGTIYDTIRYREIKIRMLSKKEQAEVLQAFSRWAIEQEEAE